MEKQCDAIIYKLANINHSLEMLEADYPHSNHLHVIRELAFGNKDEDSEGIIDNIIKIKEKLKS